MRHSLSFSTSIYALYNSTSTPTILNYQHAPSEVVIIPKNAQARLNARGDALARAAVALEGQLLAELREVLGEQMLVELANAPELAACEEGSIATCLALVADRLGDERTQL